jgi:hydrogenase/urease accessory protein HupE
MDLTQFAMAGFVIIGLVNGIQFAFNRNWQAFAFFITAVVAGAVFGYLKWFGLPSMELGLAVGISSSGVYKVAQKLGGS